MSFKLPDLPYDYIALEPHIDEATMRIHHDKHHAGYVEKLNKALEGKTELQKLSIEDLLGKVETLDEDIREAVINNGGGHANHSLFWKIMSPDGRGSPKGELKSAIDMTFGSFDKFKETFSDKALTLFGSGWVFLVVKDGTLICKRHSFQNSPLMHGATPLLALDVWEHAYYLKYQNKRVDYINAWWNVVNWKEVSKNFSKVK